MHQAELAALHHHQKSPHHRDSRSSGDYKERREREWIANVFFFVALASYRMMRRTDLKTQHAKRSLVYFCFSESREQAKSPGRGERATTSHTHNTWQRRTGSLIADYDALHRGWWRLGLSFLRTLACFLLHKRHDSCSCCCSFPVCGSHRLFSFFSLGPLRKRDLTGSSSLTRP